MMSNQYLTFPIGQDWLIQSMRKLKYYSNNGGICAAVALAGMMEIFCKNVDEFDLYLNLLKEYYETGNPNLADDIEAARQQCRRSWQVYKAKYGNLHETPQLILNQYMQDDYRQLPESQRYLSEIDALFNLVEILYKHYRYDIFDKNVSISFKISDIISLMLPYVLQQQGGINIVVSYEHFCNQESLSNFLDIIHKNVMNNIEISQPPVFMISNATHAISLGYDRYKQSWIYINANKLSKRYIVNELQVAYELIDGFFDGNSGYLTLDTYAMQKDSAKLAKILDDEKIKIMITRNQVFTNCVPSALWVNKEDFHASLLKSIRNNQPEILNALVLQIKSNNEYRKYLIYAVYLAVKYNQINLLKIVLTAQPTLNGTDKIGRVLLPLHAAVRKEHAEIVSLLLSHGAKAYTVNQKGETAIDIANAGNNRQIQDLLTKQLRDEFFAAVKADNGAHIIKLIKICPDLKHNNNIATALCMAISRRRLKLAQILLETGVSPNKILYKIILPLNLAVKNTDEDMIKLLLCFGAKAYITNNKGVSALDIAHRIGNSHIIELIKPKPEILMNDLLQAVRDGNTKRVLDILRVGVNPKDTLAPIILRFSMLKNKDTVIISALLDAGFNPYKKIGGRVASAFEYASSVNAVQIQELIIQHTEQKRTHSNITLS